MKFLVSLIFIAIIALTVYRYMSKEVNRTKKQKHLKIYRKPLVVTGIVVIVLLGFLAFLMYRAGTVPDTQCTTVHALTSNPPVSLNSALDYFLEGNYDYDSGNCRKAIADYGTSIRLNPNYPEAYNNRAYTYMRMQNYQAALLDLNKALVLNPDYIQALMNRGDIHNYYFAIDRQSAIFDYKKVIALNGAQGTSVCGHLFLAEHNGWNLGTILDFPRVVFSMCK